MKRCELCIDNQMTTSWNWFWFGAFISVTAQRCINALRTVQTDHAATQLYTTVNRRTCSSVPTPRITTHYTVHSRDQDSRWEGKNAERMSYTRLYATVFRITHTTVFVLFGFMSINCSLLYMFCDSLCLALYPCECIHGNLIQLSSW